MITPADDYHRWEAEVRDPAKANREPECKLKHGHERVEYSIAQIPGGWAWRCYAQVSDYSGSASSWNGPVPTRDDALAAALTFATSALSGSPDSVLAARINPDQGVLL
ncbi:hypothetical protein H5399_05165 [Tessaracoccus sp. MC1627]|uniref:hypothetical protein n=1 Tax=Tessaracoccus sp. MC1627 TaxID=2760312 RepID=UPI0015FF26C2|nr:hypothetical protein [Tessaracoccus sp. MC1627]MBB1511994.1 hypothetical protein [Tessaracoccus sp. MC1627]